MSILKEILSIVKLGFLSDKFTKSFWTAVFPEDNYQKQTAENLAKIAKEKEEINENMKKGFEALTK